MRSKIQFSAARNYFLGFATSGLILVSGLYYFNAKSPNETSPHPAVDVEYAKAKSTVLKNFDPNALSETDWQSLGFSERQVATILKYKQVVGGSFTSKEQLKKCYSISSEKFEELEPYILLPDKSTNPYPRANQLYSYRDYRPHAYSKTRLNIPGKFNPDNLSAQDFVKMGFTANQANSILKYKNYLGGSFISKEKFQQCYMISDEKYEQMEPYLLLPDQASENSPVPRASTLSQKKPAINHQPFDPNETDLEGWQKLGFSQKQAQVIVNYRDRNLKGSFKTLDEIERCFVISPEKFAEIKPYIQLSAPSKNTANTENIQDSTPKNSAPESKTDFTSVDLNHITFRQLTEFGLDDKSAAMILSYRKKLGGFVTKQQIVDTYDIDKALAQKLVNIAHLDDSKVEKYTLVDAPEEWLKTHPYFKYSADKIIFYRISYPDDKKIWKFLKVKPEYEQRMRMYLR